MYIKKVEISNIRSIHKFSMDFPNPAGWHVLIGDNGAGKSTIIRSISLGLIGIWDAQALRDDWDNWLTFGETSGIIDLVIERDDTLDHKANLGNETSSVVSNMIFFKANADEKARLGSIKGKDLFDPEGDLNLMKGWFSAAFGPYRRFAGGSSEWSKVFSSQNRLSAHLSAFGEDVALVEATEWLVKLYFQSLEEKDTGKTSGATQLIKDFKALINSPDFLPHGAELDSISSEGVKFKDGNDNSIDIGQMSDGYRSILSLTFELIRQMINIYGSGQVFEKIREGNVVIDLPGVVLIDEVDAHLHPSWQTRIGQWFIKYFPKIQFIVTTHSPLVCRAAKDGTIWRLSRPGSAQPSAEIKGLEKERLIFGNILDAYGTEVFGDNVSISKDADEKLNEMAELNVQSLFGDLSEEQEKRLQHLKSIFPTENPAQKR